MCQSQPCTHSVHTLCLPFLSLSFNSFFSSHRNTFTTLLLSVTLSVCALSLSFLSSLPTLTLERRPCAQLRGFSFFLSPFLPTPCTKFSHRHTRKRALTPYTYPQGETERYVHGERGELLLHHSKVTRPRAHNMTAFISTHLAAHIQLHT